MSFRAGVSTIIISRRKPARPVTVTSVCANFHYLSLANYHSGLGLSILISIEVSSICPIVKDKLAFADIKLR